VREIVNTRTGAVVQQIDYDEYGNVLSDSHPGFSPFGFAGGLYDRDTKFVRFGKRDFDASTGRWMSKDPIRFLSGNWNHFAYVNNDPINQLDVKGTEPLTPKR
jgi:RHS repeat-associated protein